MISPNVEQMTAFVQKKLLEVINMKKEKAQLEIALNDLNKQMVSVRTSLSNVEEKIKGIKYEITECCDKFNTPTMHEVE